MVLRDTYIISMLRTAAFFFLLLMSSCGETPATADSAPAATATEPAKKPVHNAVTDQAQTIRNGLQSVMSEMYNIYSTAQDLRTGNGKEKDGSNTNDKNAEVVLRKSGTVLGSMSILEGSLSAIEQRFNEGMLDQKQAQEMLNKASIDLQSYKDDVKRFRDILGDNAPVKTGKSEKK